MATRCSLILLWLLAGYPAGAATVPAGYQQVAQQAGVPAEILYAVALTESGSRLPNGIRPWPWTLNVAGTGYHYASRQQACAALQQFMQTTSLRRIDIGLGQINLGWNGYHFSTPCEALAPYPNLRVTASLLRQHYDKYHDWLEAAGRYHHPAGGKPAQRYRQRVYRHLQLTMNK